MFDSEEGQTYSFDETMESPPAPVNPFLMMMGPKAHADDVPPPTTIGDKSPTGQYL